MFTTIDFYIPIIPISQAIFNKENSRNSRIMICKIKKNKNINSLKKIFILIFLILIFFNKNITGKYLNLYIVTHKDFQNKINNSYYKIICDTKDQLKNKYQLEVIESYKNNELYPKKRGYCEGSKIYYIWKNYKLKNITSRYVGFNHYRRIFHFQNEIPNLDKIFNRYDVIINKEVDINNTIIKQFSDGHFGTLIDETLEIIKNKFSEYYSTAINTLNKTTLSFCNIFIMKKKDFIKYGEFVFGILIEFDKRHNLTNDNDILNFIQKEINKLGKNNYDLYYQSRQEGFMLERISNIFNNYHFKKKFQIVTTN